MKTNSFVNIYIKLNVILSGVEGCLFRKFNSYFLQICVTCFFIFPQKTTFAQNPNYSDLNQLIQKKKYAACIKKADKKIQEFPDHSLPHFYKAIALFFDSQGSEKKTKEKEVDFLICMKEFMESRKNWSFDTAQCIAPKIIRSIQNTAISYISKNYNSKKIPEADSLAANYLQIFDNKWTAFTNYTFMNFYHAVFSYAESSKTDKIKIFSDLGNRLSVYLSALPQKADISMMKDEQMSFFSHYKKLDDKELDTLADRQLLLVLQKYDNTSELQTNYIAFDVFDYFTIQIKKASKKNAEKYTNRLYKIIEKCPGLFIKKEACRFEEEYCFKEWEQPQYIIANTAKNANYLTEDEKDIIYLMNLARINPKLFKETFVKKYLSEGPSNEAERSLLSCLERQKALALLYPSEKLSKAAAYHAKDMGETGLEGHNSSDKTGCNKRLERFMKAAIMGENCEYGSNDPIDIVMQLLIDEGIPGYGHRLNILSNDYSFVGTSKKPHKKYEWNTVMDFAGNGE